MQIQSKMGQRQVGRSLVVLAVSLAFLGHASAQQGGMMQQEMADLSTLAPDQQVESLHYCEGSYRLMTAEGDALEFPEFNLRFKTDASEMGPPEGSPALLPAGMMGDRAFVIFASPNAISAFIETSC